MRSAPTRVWAVFCVLAASFVACGSPESPKSPDQMQLSELRESSSERDEGVLAPLLLAELLAPGGKADRATQTRKRLDESKRQGLYEDLARGLDDELHGRLATAPEHFLRAARAARDSDDPNAPLFARFAVKRATQLRGNSHGLWDRWREWVVASIQDPGKLGWRARSALVTWWGQEAWDEAARDVEVQVAVKAGCLPGIRLAGPFGNGATADALRSHAAEGFGPWPVEWPRDELSGHSPRVLKTRQAGCVMSLDEPVPQGVFYAEATFEIPRSAEVILAVRDALAVWVDGVQVQDRGLTEWGSWTRVGTGLRLAAGPHRVVAKLTSKQTAIRVLHPDGRPFPAAAIEPGGLHALTTPKLSREVNLLRRYVGPDGVTSPESAPLTYVAAYLAHQDGEAEVATLLLESLVDDPEVATGPALALAASLVEHDPIYEASQTEDLVRELHERALKRDPKLWASELSRVSHVASSKGLVDAVSDLKRLTRTYEQVPALWAALAKVYGELGWTPEYVETVKLRAERFPDDAEGLFLAAQVLEQQGQHEQAERLYERVRGLDKDSEVTVSRAIERRDYEVAIAELKRLQARRPELEHLERRIEELRVQSGQQRDIVKVLRDAVEREPTDGEARLNLADALRAKGDVDALEDALVDGIEAGADTKPIKEALDLIQGVTELEPYRLNGREIIREYEAAGQHMPGTAARVLDYMAVWVSHDGSSRYLEHEIIRIQSAEGISRFAEAQVRGDVVLNLRVIKQDGRILEPEPVEGKPTITFPHLEVGDYIETEELFGSPPRAGGAFHEGLRWLFREKDVAYARSEFVLVAPEDRSLDIEVTGDVPEPQVTNSGHFTVRRWRVDQSPAASDEPFSVPATEYLPSLHISWGLDLKRRLAMLADRVAETVPVDPRVKRVALAIAGDIPEKLELQRARALYRWVLDNVQPGDENDGRRVIVGKRGNPWRAFITLCRSIDIHVDWALAKNRLAAEPKGPASRAAQYNTTVLLVGRARKPVTLIDKYYPFGYVPAEVRAMPAYVLGGDSERIELPSGGAPDRLEFVANVDMAKDGSANIQLAQVYAGKFAAGMRQALGQLGERRLKDSIESEILAPNLRGARLVSYDLGAMEQLDAPLKLSMRAKMAHFALRHDGDLRLVPPYTPNLSQFGALPTRQTPMLFTSERNWRVKLTISLPPTARIENVPTSEFTFNDYRVAIRDRVEDGQLVLEREISLPAGRIATEDYEEFVRFTRDADAALSREFEIDL